MVIIENVEIIVMSAGCTHIVMQVISLIRWMEFNNKLNKNKIFYFKHGFLIFGEFMWMEMNGWVDSSAWVNCWMCMDEWMGMHG